MTEDPDDAVSVPISWIGVDESEVAAANRFVMTHNPETEELILIFGHVAPPILLGTEEERLRQAEELAFVPVRTLGRFSMTRPVAGALREVINEHLERYDRNPRGEEHE